MMKYLKLIRWTNLLIVAGTLCLMRWFILEPLLKFAGFSLLFSTLDFLLMVLSAVCYTAAGYVINDYFDTQTDTLNRPESVIVGKEVSRRAAMALHFALNSLAAILGVYISFHIGIPALAIICLIIPGILWFYSTTYKRQFLLGNIIVALLTALVPLAVFLSEMPLQVRMHRQALMASPEFMHIVLYWIGGFSFFAFILTLVREIVKDIEDFEGDAAFGRNSLPVVIGVPYTKLVLYLLIAITEVVIFYTGLKFVDDTISQLYFLLLLFIPLLLSTYLIFRAVNRKDYTRISLLLKLIMLSGLGYAVAANFIMRYSLF